MDEPMDKAMGNRVLVVFHTSEGQTARIADRIGDVLRAAGDTVDVVAVDEAPDVSKYDAVVLGDSIHVGHYSHAFSRYVKANAVTLNAMPTALFQVSLVSANPDAEHAATAHTLVQKLLDDTGLDPDIVGMFAGALVYTRYGWFTRRVMRSIVKREGGDTDTSHDYEYTDWDAVEHFARDVDALATAAR